MVVIFRKYLLTLLLITLVMLSGCIGVFSGEGRSSTPTSIQTTESQPSTAAQTETFSQTPTTGPETIDYDSLSPEERRVFDAARTQGEIRIEGSVPDGLYSNEYVRYHGTLYRVRSSPSGNIARYQYVVRSVSNDSAQNESKIRDFRNLSSFKQQRFEELRTGDGTTEKRIPNVLLEKYIRYDGTLYETEVISTSDMRIWTVEVVEQ